MHGARRVTMDCHILFVFSPIETLRTESGIYNLQLTISNCKLTACDAAIVNCKLSIPGLSAHIVAFASTPQGLGASPLRRRDSHFLLRRLFSDSKLAPFSLRPHNFRGG